MNVAAFITPADVEAMPLEQRLKFLLSAPSANLRVLQIAVAVILGHFLDLDVASDRAEFVEIINSIAESNVARRILEQETN